jgi:phosphate acetyltransferase
LSFIEDMIHKAKIAENTLVLPEGTEPRTLQAAKSLVHRKIAKTVMLLGKQRSLEDAAQKIGVDLEGLVLIDPAEMKSKDRYAEEYYQLRKHKGMTIETAREEILDPLKWGAMMVRLGDAHSMVAGAENSTGKVLVSAFTIIKTAPGTKFASSCFIINTHKETLGVEGHLVFADCATIPEPDPEQLAEIAIASSDSCTSLLEAEPITALLSYSTKGSARSAAVDSVLEVLRIIKDKRPELTVDGELQLDAALVPEVGNRKAPDSPVAGKANVLIFPNLAAGNIGYKLVQRIAGADAYGPFLQGFAKPVSDLSRGCSVNDIINTAAVTLAME